MADVRRRATQPLILRKLQADLPTWAVHLVGQDIMALSPPGDDPTAALNDIRGVTHTMGLQVVAQSRQGRVIVTIDLTGIPFN